MIKTHQLKDSLGKADVYLLDQFMKGLYKDDDIILDAGCGHGRHVDFFTKLDIDIYGVDKSQRAIIHCSSKFTSLSDRFSVQELENLSFESDTFDHVLSSAVFHFAQSYDHFRALFAEHIRVLKTEGTLFIRMTSYFGLDPNQFTPSNDGVYLLPDGTSRFLITYDMIDEMCAKHHLVLLEQIKTVNVNDKRAMAVLVFKKSI